MQFAYMKIQVHIEDRIVEFVDSDDISSLGTGYVNSPKFKIVARRLGITTLYVSSLLASNCRFLLSLQFPCSISGVGQFYICT